MKNILKIFNVLIAFLIIILFTFLCSFFIVKTNYKNVSLNIKKGELITDVYQKLNLKYGIFDKIYLKIDNKITKLNIGSYRFNGKLSKYEVLNKIKNGKTQEIRLTIPEGFTKKQVFERMTALGLGTQDEINKALSEINFPYPHENNEFEGYFYPETYIFPKNITTKEVLDRIFDEFLKHFPEKDVKDKQKFYEQLKLASIVESEVNNNEDKPKVAGVFLKRLDKKMRLESDATLKYDLGRQAKRGELKATESPYNSYRVGGLPPTPISNPAADTIKAVQNPVITEDLFFFMHNGKTYYSKTHDEHLKKRKESGQLK